MERYFVTLQSEYEVSPIRMRLDKTWMSTLCSLFCRDPLDLPDQSGSSGRVINTHNGKFLLDIGMQIWLRIQMSIDLISKKIQRATEERNTG